MRGEEKERGKREGGGYTTYTYTYNEVNHKVFTYKHNVFTYKQNLFTYKQNLFTYKHKVFI